jgi:hypothetical protein
MIAREDFTAKNVHKRRNAAPLPSKPALLSRSGGPYRIFSQSCCRHSYFAEISAFARLRPIRRRPKSGASMRYGSDHRTGAANKEGQEHEFTTTARPSGYRARRQGRGREGASGRAEKLEQGRARFRQMSAAVASAGRAFDKIEAMLEEMENERDERPSRLRKNRDSW